MRQSRSAAVLAAAAGEKIDNLVLQNFFASYRSKDGYGGRYVYRDANNHAPATQQTANYGSGIVWIPDLLDYADAPQLLALCAPRNVLLLHPLAADGKSDAGQTNYDWTTQAFALEGAGRFARVDRVSDQQVIEWMDGGPARMHAP